jgi:bifunctional UDP-N-acetylglucosamine pyrophosphorylase/glucosamine-1-phosphate N-acetyltransferase
MKAVILAAGEGSRMRPLTFTHSKVMLPVANRPLMEYLFEEIIQAGIKDFIFIVGYRGGQVCDYFGDGSRWGVSIVYREQTVPQGTGDAVLMATDLVDGPFLVFNGDIIAASSDIKILAAQQGTAIGVKEVKDTHGLGTVEVDAGGRVLHLHEKLDSPPTRLANTGVYLFTPRIFDAIQRTPRSCRGEYELPQAVQLLVDSGEAVISQAFDSWADVSYPWDLLGFNERRLNSLPAQNMGIIEENVVIRGNCSIGEGSRIRSGSYIVGPVLIGSGCDVGPNCYIRPFTSIGNNCHIGAAVEVKNCIIMNGSKLPHHNYAGDSIIGEGCNLGAGTKIANLRFDGAEVTVDGVNTHRRKFGAVLGDNVNTGINVSINTGTLVGNGVCAGPGTLLHGVIDPGSFII